MRTLLCVLLTALLGCEAPDSGAADSAVAASADEVPTKPGTAAHVGASGAPAAVADPLAGGAPAAASASDATGSAGAASNAEGAAAGPAASISPLVHASECATLPPKLWPADPSPDDAAWPIPGGRRPTREEARLLVELRASGGTRYSQDAKACPVADPFRNAGRFSLGGVSVVGVTSRQEIVAEALAKDARLLLTMLRDRAPVVRAYAAFHLLRAGHPASPAILARTMADSGRMQCQFGCMVEGCTVSSTVYASVLRPLGAIRPLPPAALATLESTLRARAESLPPGPRETALADVVAFDAWEAEARDLVAKYPSR